MPTVSFGRDVAIMGGTEADKLLTTCLCEGENSKGQVGILGLWEWIMLKAPRGWGRGSHAKTTSFLWGFWKVKPWDGEGEGC